MKLLQIEDGIVVNIISVDADNIPEFCADWPESTDPSAAVYFQGSTFNQPILNSAKILADRREKMVCSKMQGILTLGETNWGDVLAYRDLATTTWS